jgi:uncharacterized protein (DUF2126 family)
MPPHARMSAAQILLLRALVARFWQQPYEGTLVRWGTALHDRWLLPQFVAADLHDVVADLNAFGYAFAHAWFAPFQEFRFPRFGSVTYDNVTIELRQAIEPWHVLGEEVSGTGTARYVDSSVERLQVKVMGMTMTGIASRYGARCRWCRPASRANSSPACVTARNPPSGLHPTIGQQAPLVFDLVDMRAAPGRRLHSITSCIPAGATTTRFRQAMEVSATCRALLGAWPHAGRHEARRRAPQSSDADNPRSAVAAEIAGLDDRVRWHTLSVAQRYTARMTFC